MANATPIPPAPVPVEVDVYAIRRQLRLTQRNFAHAFGLKPSTVRDWEQQRARPDATARAYLTTIARNAPAVREALRDVRQ